MHRLPEQGTGGDGLLGRRRGLQDFRCTFDIGLPDEQADAGANRQVRTHAPSVVRADGGFDAGRFERALGEVGFDVVQDIRTATRSFFSHGNLTRFARTTPWYFLPSDGAVVRDINTWP